MQRCRHCNIPGVSLQHHEARKCPEYLLPPEKFIAKLDTASHSEAPGWLPRFQRPKICPTVKRFRRQAPNLFGFQPLFQWPLKDMKATIWSSNSVKSLYRSILKSFRRGWPCLGILWEEPIHNIWQPSCQLFVMHNHIVYL